MTRERYRALMTFWQDRPAAARVLKGCSKVLTGAVYLAYILAELWLALRWEPRLWRMTLVPLAVFLGGTVLRRTINAPRPYEVFGIPPLTRKDTKGQSFPSRHVFSASVIGVGLGWLCPPWGWAFLGVAAAIALTRVLTGVHFPRDVAAGLALGVVLGWLGFFVI